MVWGAYWIAAGLTAYTLTAASLPRSPWVRWPLMGWVDFFRAFPPLVLLVFFFADLLSNTLEVAKLISLGSVVAMPELRFQARQAQSLTYSLTPIVLAALIYFLMLWPLVRVLSRLENRALAGQG